MSEDGPPAAAHPLSGKTAWARSLQTPQRLFLRTETGGAAVLLGWRWRRWRGSTSACMTRCGGHGCRSGSRVPVVDDLVSLVVIGAAYAKALVLVPLLVAAGIFAVILVLRRAAR